MNKSVITLGGLDILNDNVANGDKKQYWIGYYGLAYIPDDLRHKDQVGELKQGMSTLVPLDNNGKPIGDELFNIFQGSMADTVAGFDEGDVDSAASRLYKQCLYAENIESTFRYALLTDRDGNKINTLVTFSQDASDPAKYNLYRIYVGSGCSASGFGENDITTDPQVVESDYGIPMPASLFYATQADDTAGKLLPNTVTADMRNYKAHSDPDWSASNDSSREVDDVLEDVQSMLEVANFNRYHAPSSSEGYSVAHEPACRNMAKVTKLFPIEHYDIASIVHAGGLIQNLETGKSSTNLDNGHSASDFENAKVGTIKYKIQLNISDYMKKTSERIFRNANDDVKIPPVGFKFNRIGLYAVPVTLHSFNVVDAENETCGGNKVQLQVDGDADPVLFAVIDTDTIEMSETGLAKYVANFSVNYETNTALVNNPVIFYNLYENDSITWYKNQLLANASTSEAVTTLGVELNYLRNMIEGMNSRESECGIGDDGDMWAFKNHTHPYMRNIVDSADTNFGAVRGIYTMSEYESYDVYRTCGEDVSDDADPSTLAKIININSGSYTVGENSMTLGKDSLAASGYSINMSNYGFIDKMSKSVFLMGGRGKNSNHKYNDEHLAVSNAFNSIINADYGEFEYLNGSLWITSYADVYVNGGATHSIGIGKNDVLRELFDETAPNEYIGNKKYGSVSESVLVGRNSVIGNLKVSMIVGSQDSSGSQLIGDYDVAANMNDLQMDSDVIGYGNEDKIFDSSNRQLSSIVVVGSSNNVQKGVQGVFATGIENVVPTNSKNLVIVGERINKAEPTYTFDNRFIMTVDEFNARYGDVNRFPYPSDDPIWTHDGTNDMVIIGTGEVNFLNGQSSPTIKTVNVKGVTLYIAYSSYTWQTDNAYTCGNYDDPETNISHFGNNPYMYTYLYTKPGNLKNMMMIGDDLNVGNGSSNTIMIGDKSGTRKIKYTNSFINTLGDDFGYNLDKSCGAAGHFDNVWWIGHTESPQDNVDMSHSDVEDYAGHLIVAQNQTENGWQNAVFKDRFVFIGDDKNAYGFSYWYGVDYTTVSNLHQISKNSENWEYDINDVYSPCKAPMMYTGGIALGGYGTAECNFMLMKVGTSRKYYDDTDDFINILDGYNVEPNLMTYRGKVGKIIRSNHIQGPWVETADNTTLIVQTGSDSSYLEIGEVTHEFIVSDTRVIVTDSVEITMTDMQDEPMGTMTVNVSGNTITGTIAEAKSVRVKLRLEYKYYDSTGSTIYDYYDPDVQSSHHLMVDCPYKGMALVVQDKQELDGTLHIGLGKTGGMGGGGGIVIIRDALVTYFYLDNPSSSWDPTSHISNKMTVYKNGEFNEIPIRSYTVQDGYRDYFWDYDTPNHAQEHFSFGNNNKLVWYTWDCFVWAKKQVPLEEVVISNMKRNLCIWNSDLVDGVVYEVIIYVQAMSASEHGYTVRSGTTMNFILQFYNDDGTAATVYKWADSDSIDYEIYPDFNIYVQETDMTELNPLYSGATINANKSNPILARAVVHFTKVDGIIYLMTY